MSMRIHFVAMAVMSFICFGLVPTQVWGQAPDIRIVNHQKFVVDEMVRTYALSANASDFIEREKDVMPIEDYKFLKQQLVGTEKLGRPILERRGDLEFSVKVGGRIARYELIAGDQYHVRVNNRLLSLGTTHTAEERWKMLMDALPKTDSVGLIMLIEPSANASWASLKSAAGAGAVLGMFGFASGLITQKDSVCSSLKTAVTDCRKILATMRSKKKWLSKEQQHEEALAKASEAAKKAAEDKMKQKKQAKAKPEKPKPEHKKKKGDDDEDEPFDPMTYDITEEDGYEDVQNAWIDATGQIDDVKSQTQTVLNKVCPTDRIAEAKACRSEAEKYAVKLKIDDGKPSAPDKTIDTVK